MFFRKKRACDNSDLAYKKPVRASDNQKSAFYVTDGTRKMWRKTQYPAYVQIDLEKNAHINRVNVKTPAKGYTQYSIYTSVDGVNFTFLCRKTSNDSCPIDGENWTCDVKARFVRVFIEYNSETWEARISGVSVYGEFIDEPVKEIKPVIVPDFKDTEYNSKISDEEITEEVYSLVSRTAGDKYRDWFAFSLAPSESGRDYFTLSDSDGRVHIEGNNGGSLAVGLNHYYKYFCNVHISQVGCQMKMPETVVPVGKTVHMESAVPVRYSYNYCALSYTMAFWGEKEWRRELDWLALNGVNAVLDITAQEEVWRRFLTKLGYSHAEIKDFIAGPAYYAWAYMANISGFGGPVHDSWFASRTELARKNHRIMRRYGMKPVLQGYGGMVPADINEKDSSAKVIRQGLWNAFRRPDMLRTDSDTYVKYAKLFYESQDEVFGNVTKFYATDPFHEGGKSGNLKPETVGKIVMREMLRHDENSVWVIQSWGENPSNGLINGIASEKEHALILDLYAENRPHWEKFRDMSEFSDTPWAWCMLNNFGGRMGLHGHMQSVVNEIPRALHKAKFMRGIGITPEATFNNPVLFDLIFETIWSETPDDVKPIDIDVWLKNYTRRRYGAESESAYKAMCVYRDTVYSDELNKNGEGAPESVINARPALEIKSASSWGTAKIGYDKVKFEEGIKLLLADYDKLKNSDGYLFDLADGLKQMLSNTAQEYHLKMVEAYKNKDLTAFHTWSRRFVDLAEFTENVLGTREEFLLGNWISKAERLADNTDDFTKMLYELNARAQITTWGAVRQANDGGLRDYSNKQWAGLTKDLYLRRWQQWIIISKLRLKGEKRKDIDFFALEWDWARKRNKYPTEPNGLDLKSLAEEAFSRFSSADVENLKQTL